MPLKPIKKASTYKVVKKAPKRNTRLARRRATPKKLTFLDNSRLMPYPAKYTTKFHSSIFGYFPAGLTDTQHSVLLNGCNDMWDLVPPLFPNARPTLLGLKPTGFTVMCNGNLYHRYRVNAMKMTINLLPEALGDSVLCTMTPTLRPGLPTTTEQALTQPFTKSGYFNSSKEDHNSKGGARVVSYFKMYEFLGIKKAFYDNDISGQFDSNFNVDPVKPIWMTINISGSDGTATTRQMGYRVDIVQYVDLFENSYANIIQS